jgi:hypothetical protein
MIDKNKILLIAGSGKNIGKTTLVCNIIKQNKDKNIVAIKVSPHFHKVENCKLLFSDNLYQIYKEQNLDGIKDSSKMLLAGAKAVYYIQAKDEALELAYKKISGLINSDCFVVCESGGLRDIIKPAIFLFIKHIDDTKQKSKHLIPLADGVLVFEGEKYIWQKKLEINFLLKIQIE